MNKIKKRINKLFNKLFAFLTLNIIFPKVYKKAAKKPIDPNKLVFVEVRMDDVSNSFKVIFNELVNNYSYTVHTHFLKQGKVRKKTYLKRCVDMLRDAATAKVVFTNDASNCLGSIKFRPETKTAQLWHGCGAFKKFGLSIADMLFGASRKEQLKHSYYNKYDLVTVSSPEVAWAYIEAMNLSDKPQAVKATGSSRTDVFYDKEFINNAYNTLYDIVPQAKGKKVILYAPTFRGNVGNAYAPNLLNVKMFYENFGDDYVLLFKHHPFVKKLPAIPNEYSDFAVDVSRVMDIEDLLVCADICISDYSSLVFEYSLFERPLIFFAYDLDSYFNWRGFYYDYFEMSPGPICSTNLEMIDYIKNIDTRFDKQKIKDFRDKFMSSCDGHATDRILEDLLGKESLDAHKKATISNLPFDKVPKSNGLYRDYISECATLQKKKKLYSDEYKKQSARPVICGKTVLLDCTADLKAALNNCTKFISLTTSKDVEKNKEIIGTIADAEFVFIEYDNSLLDLITLRAETKVIYVPKCAFAFKKTGKATLSYQSGIYGDKYEIAPMYNNIKYVCIPTEAQKDIYGRTVCEDESTHIYTGDIKADCLMNQDLKSAAMDKLKKLCGDLNGKKILLDFVVRDNGKDAPKSYESQADNYLYEYLKDDYIILKYFTNYNDGKLSIKATLTQSAKAYQKGFYDVTNQLTEYEAISVADVIIGSFSNGFVSSFAAMKPTFAYVPDFRARLRKVQANYDYENILPCPVITDPETLVKSIRNISEYDFTKLKEWQQTYIGNADGKAAQKLIKSFEA